MIFWSLALTVLLIAVQLIILYCLVYWEQTTLPLAKTCSQIQSNWPWTKLQPKSQLLAVPSIQQPASATRRYCFDLPIAKPQVKCTTSCAEI